MSLTETLFVFVVVSAAFDAYVLYRLSDSRRVIDALWRHVEHLHARLNTVDREE